MYKPINKIYEKCKEHLDFVDETSGECFYTNLISDIIMNDLKYLVKAYAKRLYEDVKALEEELDCLYLFYELITTGGFKDEKDN